ncbi:MAG: SDR family NAD(P)-dependent oxidoreductase, partial [Okeania sp. SIO2D1]|nr:SDR family NAD(P)-dependent oxidoreductase [Okeania sp. SIO2D1]
CSKYQQLDAQHYQINPTVAEQFPKLLQDNSDIKGILHLWGINETEDLQTAQKLGCATALHLVQALVQAGLTNVIPMWLVTQGTQNILDAAEVVQPLQGSLWGLGRVISLEHPDLRCGRIDLDPTSNVSEIIPSLIDEVFSDENEDQIAIRQGVRYVARLVRQQKQKFSDEQKSIKPEASYLITGGLGALGLEVAQWMVKQGAKHIVLTGRRSPNETAQKIIEELEAAGSKVIVLLGDISTQDSVMKILETISASLPPLKGVIHAAGVLSDGVLQKMSWEEFTKVMAPKVSGTWYLHQLTQDLPLDFFVCFSSMASMLGNAGQGNYAAANAFMDAIAHYRRGQGLPGLSINWGAWAAGGMAARLASEHQNRMQSSGVVAIDIEAGMQALGSLLSGSQSQVGVFPVNWSEFFRQTPTAEKIPFLSGFVPSQPSLSQKFSFIEELEAKAIPDRMELLTAHIRSMLAQTLGISDAKIGMGESFFDDLGLDSLMAVELKNRIESILNVSLSSTLLFDYPILKKLVNHLADDVIPIEFSMDNGASENNVDMEADDSSIDNSSRFQEMSEDDVVDLLAKKLESLGG